MGAGTIESLMSYPASVSLQSVRVSNLKVFGRVVLAVLLLALVLVGGGFVWFHAAAQAAMPALVPGTTVIGLRFRPGAAVRWLDREAKRG